MFLSLVAVFLFVYAMQTFINFTIMQLRSMRYTFWSTVDGNFMHFNDK